MSRVTSDPNDPDLTRGSCSAKECEFRVGNESVGWRDCPSPNDVLRLLETWILAMTHPLELDPISMHVEFEHIHPFRDGNGRVGRLLLWWHEVKRGDQPTKILFREVEKYYSLFRGPLDDA